MTKPQKPTFFVDRALGPSVVKALQIVGAQVEAHADYFAPNSPDTEWLPVVSQRGWVVLTKDSRIGLNPLEIYAIAKAQARVFILVSGNLSRQQTAAVFAQALFGMERFTQGNQAPFIAKLYRESRITLWKNRTQLLKLLKA